jgi:hypothetical protein
MFGRFFPGFAACALLLPSLFAQQATQAVQAQEQSNVSQQVQGGLVSSSLTSSESFAPASPADSDLGDQVLLQPAQKYQAFSAWTNWNVLWTNNAPLLQDSNHSGSDTFLSGTVGGGYMPYFGGNLFGDFSAEQGMFRYARNSSLDFNSLELKAGLVYVIRALGDLSVFGNYTYDMLTARGFNQEIYSDHTLSIGTRKVFTVNRAHLFYASAVAQFSLGGEPTYALRNDFSITAGYQLSLTRITKLNLYYRVSAQDYTSSSRADFNQLIGGGVSFDITKWLSVQALSTIGINRSTEDTYNYFAANLGGGIGILVNF